MVSRREVSSRLFANWNMVAARVTPAMAPEIDRTIDDCRDNPGRAIEAVLDLVSRQDA